MDLIQHGAIQYRSEQPPGSPRSLRSKRQVTYSPSVSILRTLEDLQSDSTEWEAGSAGKGCWKMLEEEQGHKDTKAQRGTKDINQIRVL